LPGGYLTALQEKTSLFVCYVLRTTVVRYSHCVSSFLTAHQHIVAIQCRTGDHDTRTKRVLLARETINDNTAIHC